MISLRVAKKDISYFVRFGSLDLKKQNGFGEVTFHAPPAKKGFYAFPLIAQEWFLIGSLSETQPEQWPKCPVSVYGKENFTEEEKEKWDEFDWKKHQKKRKMVYSNVRKEFYKTTGNIWHHFVEHVDNSEVIARHNTWVKTSVKVWQKAFVKTSLNDRYGNIPDFAVKSINETRGISGYHHKDHYEVFFDEKV